MTEYTNGNADGPVENEVASQSETLARELAATHATVKGHARPRFFMERLSEIDELIRNAYRRWTAEVEHDFLLPVATEWLLDNYYIVRGALRQIKEDLPSGYYRELPALAAAEANQTPQPRIRAVADALVQNCRLGRR